MQTLIESEHLQGTRGSYRLVTPIERLAVPVSVQAVLAARMDRLPEREKQVLQAAAVIGKEFAEPILFAAAELPEGELRAALASLKTHEFVYDTSRAGGLRTGAGTAPLRRLRTEPPRLPGRGAARNRQRRGSARLLREAQRAFEEMGAAGHAARLARELAIAEEG